MLANKSLSRSFLVIVALTNILPHSLCAKKQSDESENSWFAAGTMGLIGGVIVGSALTAWCKDAEINDIDYRPLTSLKELNTKINYQYGKLLHATTDFGGYFNDFSYLKKEIRKELSYESFISNLEQYEREIRQARKQLKNQIKYWDKRLHDGYADAKDLLVKTKVTYKRLQSLLKFAQEMIPVLQLEQLIQCIKYNTYLHYEELSNTPKQYLELIIIDIAHRQTGKKLAQNYPLIAFEETLQEYITALTKALKLHTKEAHHHFDQVLRQEANQILKNLEWYHAALTHSLQYKNEVICHREMKHRQKIEREMQEQTRIARKQLEYEKEQLRYAREQRDTQLRTEQQIAMLRLENAIRDLY